MNDDHQNERARDGQVAGYDQNSTIHAKEPIMSIERPATDNSQPIRPIYGPSDPRWGELAACLAARPVESGVAGIPTARIEHLEPGERAQWHAHHFHGRDWHEMALAGFDYPEYPQRMERPHFAEHDEDSGTQCMTDRPMRLYYRDLEPVNDIVSTLGQEFTYDPESDEIRPEAPYVSVWVDGDTQLRFTDALKALSLAQALIRAAGALQSALDESALS